MGVLDDAIREHLELKRQRGADPGEVERQAAEALGPARREPPPAPAGEPAEVEAEEGLEPVSSEEPIGDAPPARPPTPLAEDLVPPVEPEAEAEPGFELEPEAAQPVEHAPPLEPTEPQAEVTQLRPAEEEDAEPDEVPSGERLSEDGPLDFPDEKRQEKPLWFEQSPGRDLDFDD